MKKLGTIKLGTATYFYTGIVTNIKCYVTGIS